MLSNLKQVVATITPPCGTAREVQSDQDVYRNCMQAKLHSVLLLLDYCCTLLTTVVCEGDLDCDTPADTTATKNHAAIGRWGESLCHLPGQAPDEYMLFLQSNTSKPAPLTEHMKRRRSLAQKAFVGFRL